MYCIICCQDDDKFIQCNNCMNLSCVDCGHANSEMCCFCKEYFDDVNAEVQRQIDLCYSTKKYLNRETISSDNGALIKYCPVCSTAIEKDPDDCPQIYCLVCKSVWSWTTLDITTDINSIHNPHYFTKPNRKYNSGWDVKKRIAFQSLTKLDEEEYMYASDTFTHRVAFLNKQMDLPSFKDVISERFVLHKTHKNIVRILNEYITDLISEDTCNDCLACFNCKLVCGSLPFV